MDSPYLSIRPLYLSINSLLCLKSRRASSNVPRKAPANMPSVNRYFMDMVFLLKKKRTCLWGGSSFRGLVLLVVLLVLSGFALLGDEVRGLVDDLVRDGGKLRADIPADHTRSEFDDHIVLLELGVLFNGFSGQLCRLVGDDRLGDELSDVARSKLGVHENTPFKGWGLITARDFPANKVSQHVG